MGSRRSLLRGPTPAVPDPGLGPLVPRLPGPITLIPRIHNPFRINTCKSLSKQTTLTLIESHSYKKHRGRGGAMVNQPRDLSLGSSHVGGRGFFLSRSTNHQSPTANGLVHRYF